jgi:hypothetical protein
LLRLACREDNGVRRAERTSQNTDRIARAIGNVVFCRTFWRSVLTVIITRVGCFIARISQVATADLTYGIGGLAGLSYTSMPARSVRSVS